MPEQFAPDTDRQVRDIIAWACDGQGRLAVEGTGTKSGFGYPVDADAVLSLRRLRGIIEYEPAELVMKARAGTPLEEIEAELARHGQALAFEPPHPERLFGNGRGHGTIGGVFLGNLSGPRRFVSGAARDHILGVQAVNGRGETYKSGGSVIKNVTGYDLSKLLAGSWGTLSVVTQISFKVLPLAPAAATLAVTGLPVRDALELTGRIACSACEASGLACVPADIEPGFRRQLGLEGNLVLARLEGGAASLEERTAALRKLLPGGADMVRLEQDASEAVWEAVRDVTAFADTSHTPVLLKLSVPPSAALDITRVIEQLKGCEWYCDAGGGWIWMGICQVSSEDKINSIRHEVAVAGGSAVLYRAPEAVKQNVGVYPERPEALTALRRRIKHSFDPRSVLNPGRLETG